MEKLTPTPSWIGDWLKKTGHTDVPTGEGGVVLWQKGEATTTWEQYTQQCFALFDRFVTAWSADPRGLSFAQYVQHALQTAAVPVPKRFWQTSEWWLAVLGAGGPASFCVAALATGAETLPHPWDKVVMGLCSAVSGTVVIAYKMIRTDDKVAAALALPPPPAGTQPRSE